jgi:hypothetical protein
VSLLSRDRLLVSLSPTVVSWVRLRSALKTRAVAHGWVEAIAATAADTGADSGAGREPWAGAVAALRAQALTWSRERVAVTVVLSNHFVRYALIERPAPGVSRDEELALARFHFTRLHGERALGWDVRVATADRGSRRVASAVDRELLEALRATFPRVARPRLKSVQPYLMCAFNRWRHKFDSRGGWLVLVEPGKVCLAMLTRNVWSTLQNMRTAPRAHHDWLALLEREKHRVVVQPVPTTVLARANVGADVDFEERSEWHIVMLDAPTMDGLSPSEREHYSIALQAA